MQQAVRPSSAQYPQKRNYPKQNLSLGERALYVVGGLALAAAGAKPRPNWFLSLLALGGGAALAYHGSLGYCPVKAAVSSERG